MATPLTKQSYPQLVNQVKKEIETGLRVIKHQKALTYWKVGRHISKHLLKNENRAGYGQGFYKKLSKDLNINERILQQAVLFNRKFPIPNGRSELVWTHYRALLTIGDKSARNSLYSKTIRMKLNSTQLINEIKRRKEIDNRKSKPLKQISSPTTFKKELTANYGELNAYQIIIPNTIRAVKGIHIVDAGFNTWFRVKKNSKEINFVKTRKEMSFTYKAYLERVVDGDTLLVVVELNTNNFTKQRLRLRGINTAELKTAKGKEAKKYVEKITKAANHLIIKTSKADKYDRYLADVWVENEYLNQSLLDEGLAKHY